MRVLVTGSAGFIGYHVSRALLNRGDTVFGVDNLNDYYDPALKQERCQRLNSLNRFHFQCADLSDRRATEEAFAQTKPDHVIHLAAQAGVRYSIANPHAFIQSNLVGFHNVIECCRQNDVKNFVYASSSSVYGSNTKLPYSVYDSVDHPISLYAATKRSNELLAHSYSSLYCLPTTGLRFFTVYGPWGRPDMAVFLFTKAILEGAPIQIFNQGAMFRDFTYVDDIVSVVLAANDLTASPDPEWSSLTPSPGASSAPYRLYNVGNNNPVELLELVKTIEDCVGIKATRVMMPMQQGDVSATHANVDELVKTLHSKPSTSIKTGISEFVQWYRSYYGQ